jgi:uncharacterized protein with GYD domain
MPSYRVDFSLTRAGVRRLIELQRPRHEDARKAIESVGGQLHAFYYTFGLTDGFAIVEAPSDADLAAAVLKIRSGGLVDLKTTVLISEDQFVEALMKAPDVEYEPPDGAIGS